jgi:hypothetical protein
MAPDLNSVPVSPRPSVTSNPSSTQPATGSLSRTNSTTAPLSRQNSTTGSRRASQIYPMSPPPLPLASPGGGIPISAQQGHAFPPLSPGGGHIPVSNVDSLGTPMRHPRPITPAEMHLVLEKEQEAVVNRLTRELSALRAHSASVASTTSIASSAASGALLDPNDSSHAGSVTGSMQMTPSRRHRSSSSVSRSGLPPGSYPHRYSISSQPAAGDPTHRDHRSSSVVSTPRYEEVAQQRAELEDVKRENEALKQRIRDLERMIRSSGDADAQRGRRGAPSTASTVPAAGVGTETGAVDESHTS